MPLSFEVSNLLYGRPRGVDRIITMHHHHYLPREFSPAPHFPSPPSQRPESAHCARQKKKSFFSSDMRDRNRARVASVSVFVQRGLEITTKRGIQTKGSDFGRVWDWIGLDCPRCLLSVVTSFYMPVFGDCLTYAGSKVSCCCCCCFCFHANADADTNGTLFLPPCPLARAWAVAAALGPSRNSRCGRGKD
jgi:hypothetical protein